MKHDSQKLISPKSKFFDFLFQLLQLCAGCFELCLRIDSCSLKHFITQVTEEIQGSTSKGVDVPHPV
jgi:hypothetical protein